MHLLDLIAKAESGTDQSAYTAYFSNSKDPTLTDKTLRQVQMFQAKLLKREGILGKSSAVGRYQFITAPLKETINSMGLDLDFTKFTPEVQDALIITRLKNLRKLEKWKTNKVSDRDFMINLAMEFASIPVPTDVPARSITSTLPVRDLVPGESFWSGVAGNKSGHSPLQFLQAIKDIRLGGPGNVKNVDISSAGESAPHPFSGNTMKRTVESATTENPTSGGKRTATNPGIPCELPDVADPYEYELIDSADNRYDFRLGKKIKDLKTCGSTPLINYPNYVAPGSDALFQPGVSPNEIIPDVLSSVDPTIIDTITQQPKIISQLAKQTNAGLIQEQLKKTGIGSYDEIANVLGVCDNISGMSTNYLKSFASVNNNSIRNIFGSKVIDLSDIQLNDIKSSTTSFYDHVLKDQGGSLFQPRGFIGLAGKANYERMSDKLGIDLISNPLLASVPQNAAEIVGNLYGGLKRDVSSLRNVFSVATGVDPFVLTNKRVRGEFLGQFNKTKLAAAQWADIITAEEKSTVIGDVIPWNNPDSLKGISDKPLPLGRTVASKQKNTDFSKSDLKFIETAQDDPELVNITKSHWSESAGKIYETESGNLVGDVPKDYEISTTTGGDVTVIKPNYDFVNNGSGAIADHATLLTQPTRFFRNRGSAQRQIARYNLNESDFVFTTTPGGRVQLRKK